MGELDPIPCKSDFPLRIRFESGLARLDRLDPFKTKWEETESSTARLCCTRTFFVGRRLL